MTESVWVGQQWVSSARKFLANFGSQPVIAVLIRARFASSAQFECVLCIRLVWDLIQWCGLFLRPRESLEAEISASAAGAVPGARGEAEAGRCGNPSDVGTAVALFRLA